MNRTWGIHFPQLYSVKIWLHLFTSLTPSKHRGTLRETQNLIYVLCESKSNNNNPTTTSRNISNLPEQNRIQFALLTISTPAMQNHISEEDEDAECVEEQKQNGIVHRAKVKSEILTACCSLQHALPSPLFHCSVKSPDLEENNVTPILANECASFWKKTFCSPLHYVTLLVEMSSARPLFTVCLSLPTQRQR